MQFSFPDTPVSTDNLRKEVRDFLREASIDWTAQQMSRSWSKFDRCFSKELAKRGWVGMTWPKKYGGHERTAIERYVVLEELLAVGAPCGAHWVADRQSGPLLLRIGNEAQRKLLPRMAAGELTFCIGMSEPDAGSDLAAVRSRAIRVEGGWRLSGRKVWTSNAQYSDYMIALFRTGEPNGDRHNGLSQFIVDMSASGLEVRPIRDLTGEEDFNEVTFDDVFVPEDMLVGEEGNGWKQVISELTLERAGPERYLSSFSLLDSAVHAIRESPSISQTATTHHVIGDLVAQHAVLRRMSMAIVSMVDSGADPSIAAAMVKDLGNSLEQAVPEAIRIVFDQSDEPPDTEVQELLALLMQVAPSFSLRGGTREVLRGLIARGEGLR